MKAIIGNRNIRALLLEHSALLILLILIIVSAILSPVFLTVGNVYNVLRQQAPAALIAIGVLLTILTAGIDLSSGAVLAVSHIVLAKVITEGNMSSNGGVFVAMLVAVIIGLAFGSVNGLLVSKLKMAPFIATLASMTSARGVAYLLTGGSPVRLPVEESTHGSYMLVEFGQTGDPVIGLPLAVWFVLVLVVLFWFIMKYTSFGRLIIAAGSNETAVRLAGIKVNNYKFAAYAISGVMSALAGILVTARAGIATPTAGTGYELDAIAAVVIGGASLSGGKGKVVNTVFGVLIIALIGNIMNLLSIPAYPQQIIQGIIIILAVVMNSAENKELT